MSKTGNSRFTTIMIVEITILAVGLVCLLPAAIYASKTGLFSHPTPEPSEPPQSVDSLQTQEASIISTQTALATAEVKRIPVTGADAAETPGEGVLKVTFIDVGSGDAVLIESPDGKFGLIDGGPANGKALKYLQSHGVEQLELLAASVPRPEHIGGLIEVLRVIPTARVVTNGQPEASPMYEEFLDAVAASGAVYHTARRGDALYVGGQRLDVLHPGGIVAQDLAVNSLVFRLTHQKSAFLLMGDAVNISSQEIASSVYPIKAQVLKVGHHAGDNAFSPDFLNAVQPETAVYSPGGGDDFDLPSDQTIATLRAAGARVFDTVSMGTVLVVSDSSGYAAASEFDDPVETDLSDPLPAGPAVSLTPASAALTVVVTELTSPVKAGQNAAISVETAPGAICVNTIKFSTSRGGMTHLGTRVADQNGAAGWSWRVGANATPGAFVIDILCGLNGRSAGGVISFVVTK